MEMPPDSKWPTFHDLMIAYKNCRLHKPASSSQIQFEWRLGESIEKLHAEIHSGKYRPSPAKCFIVTNPKPREIFAADFRDRVVHHLVVSQLLPIWEKKFIDASFACRTGKGTHGALKYLQKQVRRLSRGGRDAVYVLQLDLEKFFVSINRTILCEIILKHTSKTKYDGKLKQLVQTIYGHDARIGVKKSRDTGLFGLIPQGKSWFDQEPHQGIPIGNLTSQFGANVYLTGLDHFILRELKPDAYLRYMDDLLLLSHDPAILQTMIGPVDHWLQTQRHQRLNPAKTKLESLKDGISYLGFELFQTDIPSQPLQVFSEPLKKWKFVGAVRKLEKLPFPESIRNHPLSLHLPDPGVAKNLTSINSRIGALKHAHSFQFRKKVLDKFITNTSTFKGIPSELADSWSYFKLKKDYRAVLLR